MNQLDMFDFDEDVNLLMLTDGISTTSDVDYEDVVKINHHIAMTHKHDNIANLKIHN